MDDGVLKIRLIDAKERIKNLSENIKLLIDSDVDAILTRFGRYYPGRLSPRVLSAYDKDELYEFEEWISDTFEPTAPEAHLIYHLTNIDQVITEYYLLVMEKLVEKNTEVLTQQYEGCLGTIKLIDEILKVV